MIDFVGGLIKFVVYCAVGFVAVIIVGTVTQMMGIYWLSLTAVLLGIPLVIIFAAAGASNS
jgi:hypothetical protein